MWPTEADIKMDVFDAMELPGQQLQALDAKNPMEHVLRLNMQAPAGCLKLTAIAAAMGKSTNKAEILSKMIAAGMNIAVINMNFATRDENIEMIKLLRKTAKEYSTQIQTYFPLTIAVQLSSGKIRTGRIGETWGEFVQLKTGETVRLTTDETYRERCSMYTIYIDFMKFPEQVHTWDIIYLDNELIKLKVDSVLPSTIICKIERGGLLGSYKDVFVPNVTFEMPLFSDKDKKDIEMCIYNQVDFVIIPFVNSANHIEELRTLLGEKGRKVGIIASIQTINGLREYDHILKVADGIRITRQELGTDINPSKLIIAQKNMIARANNANVPVFLSAHIMSSMQHKELPSRSDLLDVANSILDGIDGIMLSPETAIGGFPVETIDNLSHACKEAEACLWTKQMFNDLVDVTNLPSDQQTCIAMAAVLVSLRSVAAAIVAVTSTGQVARLISKFRPRCPIVAVTRYPLIARKLNLFRGILPLLYEDVPDPDWQVDAENRVNFTIKWGVSRGFIRIGDQVVVVSGWQQGSATTNTMRMVLATNEHLP